MAKKTAKPGSPTAILGMFDKERHPNAISKSKSLMTRAKLLPYRQVTIAGDQVKEKSGKNFATSQLDDDQ